MKIKRIIIILLILFVMGGGIYMGISIFKGRQLSQSNLLTCRYTVGGGMLGGFNSATIRKNNDGTVNYITESAQTHADRIVTKTYVASDEDLKMIKELFIKYNIASMSKKRLSPFQVLDGDTRTISFMFDNLETFNVSDNQDLSKEDMEKFLDITKALSELAKGEAIVEIENHVLVILLDGYQIAYKMLDSKACEELIDDLDKYEFYKYEDNIQIAIINKELDISDLIKTNTLIKGELYYDNINKHLLFVYEDCLYKDEVYKIGEIEDYYDSSFDLIKNMENKEYLLMRRK